MRRFQGVVGRALSGFALSTPSFAQQVARCSTDESAEGAPAAAPAAAASASPGGDTQVAVDPARITAVVHNFLLKQNSIKGPKASAVILKAVAENFDELPILLLARVAVADWPTEAFDPTLYKKIRRQVYESVGDLTGTQVAQLIIVWGSRPSHSNDLGIFQKLGLALEYHINNVKDPELIFGVLRTMIDVKLRPPSSFVELMSRRFTAFDRLHPFTCAQCIDAMLLLHQLDGLSAISAKMLLSRIVTHMASARMEAFAEVKSKTGEVPAKMTRDMARKALQSIGLTGVRVHKLLKLVISFRLSKARMIEEFCCFLEPFIPSMSHSYLVEQLLPTVRVLGFKVPASFVEAFLTKLAASKQLDIGAAVTCMNITARFITAPPREWEGADEAQKAELEKQNAERKNIEKNIDINAFLDRVLSLSVESRGNIAGVTTLLDAIHRIIEHRIQLGDEDAAAKLVAKVRPILPTILQQSIALISKGLMPLKGAQALDEIVEKYSPDGETAKLHEQFHGLVKRYSEGEEARKEYRQLLPLPKTFHLILTINKRVHFDLAPSEKHAQMLADLHTTLCSRHPVGILQVLKVFDENFPNSLQPAIRRVFTAALLSRMSVKNVPQHLDEMKPLSPEALAEKKAQLKEYQATARNKDLPEEEREKAWKLMKDFLKDKRRTLSIVRVNSKEHLLQLVDLINETAPLSVRTHYKTWGFIAKYAALHDLPQLEETAAARAKQYRAVSLATEDVISKK